MKTRWGRFLILVLPLIIISHLTARADNSSSREEAIFAIAYQNYTSDYNVFLQDDSLYVPLEDILSFFRIYYTVDDNRVIKGYVNNADSSFSINLNGSEYEDIDGRKHKIESGQWFASELSTYVRTDLIADVFKINIRIYFNRLSIAVSSKYELPITRAERVGYVSNNFKRTEKAEDFGPLITEKTFTLLNGGILDYSLGANKSGQQTSYSFSGNLGMAVLGGEFQYSIGGSTASGRTAVRNSARWRYLFDSKLISSFSAGNIMNISSRNTGSSGYRKPYFTLMGVQLTNETSKMPTNFTDYIVEDKIEPDWNVELYINNQLFDTKRSDVTGYYRFEIPVSYGLTNITVKYYGPKGEFVSSDKVVNIPSEFLPPGEIRYAISAGQDMNTGKRLIDGTCYQGLTGWLTTSVSAVKVESSGDYTLVGQSSINLFNNMDMNLLATNTGVYECGLKLPTSFLGSLDLVYTAYDQSFGGINTNQFGTLNLRSSVNGIFTLPVTLSIMGTRNFLKTTSNNVSQYTNRNNIYTNLMFSLFNMNVSFRHNLNFTDYPDSLGEIGQTLNSNISYYFSEMRGLFSVFSRLRLTAQSNINLGKKRLSDVSAVFDMPLTKNIYLNGNYTYDMEYKSSRFSLGVNMNLEPFRSRSTADYRQANNFVSYSTDINGSVEFDSYNVKFSFLSSMGSSNNYGRSSAAIRFFNDKNYNNKFDESDELIPEADFFVTNDMATKTNSGSYKIISSLMPGSRYNIKVKPESFPNPLLVPDQMEFSFIAEPYSYKAIDIACHFGGIVEGSVARVTVDAGRKDQGGVRIHMAGKDNKFSTSVNVFSDGSYFYSGLPVGDYKVYVDSAQLKILGCKVYPEDIDLTIKPLADGDYKSSVNFILIPEGQRPTLADMKFIGKKGINPADTIATPIMPAKNYPEAETKSAADSASERSGKSLTGKFSRADSLAAAKNGFKGKSRVIYFKSSRVTYLSPQNKKDLDAIGEYLKSHPNVQLRINGHSDNSGSMEENMDISVKRANNVADYLMKKGIGKSRLIYSGHGALKPAENNSTASGRLKNSRVEIEVVG